MGLRTHSVDVAAAMDEQIRALFRHRACDSHCFDLLFVLVGDS